MRAILLVDPAGDSLRGAHAPFAQNRGRISRYDPEVSVFFAHPPELDASDWADLRALTGPGGTASLRRRLSPIPDDWTLLRTFHLVVYSGAGLETRPDDEALTLGADDVDEMLALGETIAHLNWLRHDGTLQRRLDGAGVYRFSASIDQPTAEAHW